MNNENACDAEWKKYANKYHYSWTNDIVYTHISNSTRTVELYDDEACIVEVMIRVNDNQDRIHPHPRCKEENHPDYWGWLENGDMVMIQPTWFAFDVQFAYGVDADEERENGKAYRLTVEEIGIVNEKPIGGACT